MTAAARADASPAAGQRAVHLRVAHVWCGEVMADKVFDTDTTVTLGEDRACTFTVPPGDLPPRFAMFSPGVRGYVLTLGEGMGGRARLGDREVAVDEFVRSGDGEGTGAASGRFRATPLSSSDWGVIELDGRGEHTIFFQFVPADPPIPPPAWRDTELLLPALAFALLLHTVFLVVSFALKDDGNRLLFPGRAELMAAYLVKRPEPPPEPEPVKGPAEPAASKDGDAVNVRSATKGKSGKAGGEGDKPRARTPDPGELPPEVEVGLLTRESRAAIRKATATPDIDDRLKRGLSRLEGKLRLGGRGSGTGTGTGFGPGVDGTGTTRGGKGDGPGGGGSVEGDFQSQGKVDVGETRKPKGTGGTGRARAPTPVVSTGTATGTFTGLSREEIQRVVVARSGLIRACYQKVVNRTRGLGGKLVVNFRIAADGTVKSARVVGGKSTLRNSDVESCVVRHITRLKFPAKGGAVVNYPFIFAVK